MTVPEDLAFVRARSVSEAITLLSGGGARIVAGGTDLAGILEIERDRVRKIVSIAGLEALQGVTPMKGGGVRIGALTTLAEIAKSPHLKGPFTALAQAASAFADSDLRNRATLGGNLCQRPRCWYLRSESSCTRKGGELCLAADDESRYHGIFGQGPCHMVHPSDTAPALVALDARARIVGPSGLRVVPLDEFFLLPTRHPERENVLGHAEIVTDILIPPAARGLRSAYRRVSEPKVDYAVATVSIAAAVRSDRIEHPRVVFGAAAAIPWRSHDGEAVLDGARPIRAVVAEAATAALAPATPLAENRYKIDLFRQILVDALLDILDIRE
jgi:xanthine dehydrogenase YagS FAD-binding subunit